MTIASMDAAAERERVELRQLRNDAAAARQQLQCGAGTGAQAELVKERGAHSETMRQLNRSRAAILHSAGASYEYEIKLQHARSALAAILQQVEQHGGLFRSTRGPLSSRARKAGGVCIAALREQLRDLAQRKARAVGDEDYTEAEKLLSEMNTTKLRVAALEGKVPRQGDGREDDWTSYPSTSAWAL
eukprot:gene56023-3886_t